MNSTDQARETSTHDATTRTLPPGDSSPTGVSHRRLRLLRREEIVRHGDFVADGCQGFEPWDGPTGFRADAFVKPVYRQVGSVSAAAGEQ